MGRRERDGVAIDADAGDAAMPMGIARLSKLAFDGADLKSVLHGLRDQAASGGAGPAALMDLATLEQLFGNVENGIAYQAAALEQRRLYRSPCGPALPALRLMALAAPGDIGTNTPLEFLLEGGDVALDTLYVVPDRAPVAALPEFDLAIVAVGEADSNRPVLDEIVDLVAQFHVPVLNDPRRVPLLARDRLPQLLADIPGLIVPPTVRVERARLAPVAEGAIGIADVVPGAAFPIIARPIDSHAGRGLKRLCSKKSLATYLAERTEDRFFVSPFVDYRSADGRFRKYRIVFVAGRPYACHMAIADQWMIYYLNAGMRESGAKRAEEAHFFRTFDDEFAHRHATALGAIAARTGLDYFAIDCAELSDGRLLLFEADIAMIVHAMDPPDIFPYKGPQMRKVFAAFRTLLRQRAGLAP